MPLNWQTMLSAVSQDETRTVFRTSSGAVIALDDPPHVEVVGRPAEFVGALLRELGEFDAAQRAAAKDDTLSDLGKERALAPKREKLQRLVQTTTGNALGFAQVVADLERTVLAPPVLDSTDVVGAIRDSEVRGYLRGLGGKARVEAMTLMAQSPPMIEAVMRSPTPLVGFSEVAAKLWPEHVLKTKPEAKRVVQHQEARDWANASVASVVAAAEHALKPAAR